MNERKQQAKKKNFIQLDWLLITIKYYVIVCYHTHLITHNIKVKWFNKNFERLFDKTKVDKKRNNRNDCI